jgi:hypothetical protein
MMWWRRRTMMWWTMRRLTAVLRRFLVLTIGLFILTLWLAVRGSVTWSAVWWPSREWLFLVVGIWVYTDGDRSVEDTVFLFDADALLAAVRVEIDAVFFIQLRRKLFSVGLVRFSSLADFYHKIIVEEQLAGMSSLAISKKNTIFKRDIAGVNADVNMSTAAVIPARHDRVEFGKAVFIRFPDATEPSRILNRVTALHKLEGCIKVSTGPSRIFAHGISVPNIDEDAW